VLVGEHAEGLEVDALAGLEVVAELLLRVLQVGNGLVEVGVQVAVVQCGVGLDVVGVLNDVELDARVRGKVVVDVGGGPSNATMTLPIFAYNLGWGTKLLGRASAVTVLLFIFLMAVCFIYFGIISKWEKEGRK